MSLRFFTYSSLFFLLLLATPVTHAASPFMEYDTAAQLRDVLIETDTGRIFSAAYERNQIWVFDPASMQRLEQIPVGQGPSRLAFSNDQKILACLNQQDNSVSFVRLQDTSVYATAPTGEIPVAVTALPDGRFAVANALDDTINLIEPRPQGENITLTGYTNVPSALLATDEALIVASRAEHELCVYALDEDYSLRTRIPLPDVAKQLVALPNGALLVGTPTQLLLVDLDTQSVTKKYDQSFDSICYDAPYLYLLHDTDIAQFDTRLTPIGHFEITGKAQRLRGNGGCRIALAPAEHRCYIWNSTSLSLNEAPKATIGNTALAIVGTAMPATTSQPNASERLVSEKRQLAQAVSDKKNPNQKETAPPPESKKASTRTEPSSSQNIRQHPLKAGSIRAPKPGLRPSASPVGGLSHRTIADALLQPTEFGAPGAGFQAPDWTEPLRDVKAGSSSTDLSSGRTVLKDKVQLRLGDMYFQAEEFSYSKDSGDYHAKGNVDVSQQSSHFTSDEIYYWVPRTEELPSPTLLDVPTEQEQARKRLSLGRVNAYNVHIVEPTREMQSENIDYDFAASTGELTQTRGRAGIYYYAAEKIHIRGPRTLTAQNVWVSTCDQDPPHYRLRLKELYVEENQTVGGTKAQLYLGKFPTPFYLPKWRRGGRGEYPWSFDFNSGRRADIGYYFNAGQRYELSPDFAIGPRLYPTEKEGIALGFDIDYNFMKNPASYLYRTQGELHALYTTKDRDYIRWLHRYEYNDDLVFRIQAEQWGDRDFYKDFYYDLYRNRTTPRTYANLTYRQDTYIATASTRLNTHSWIRETERLPEATFHLLERPVFDRFYFSFDTVNGYNDRKPTGAHALRTVNTARLTYDWDPLPAISLTPFIEAEAAWYSHERHNDSDATRMSTTLGSTLQTRFHKAYPGKLNFSSFKHILLPSVTYSYRPDSSLDIEDVPHFDSLDNVFGRSRIETKIDNILYGRDALTEEVWQVGRLTLYQGNDFSNEKHKADDYEIEIDIRPRPWWGVQMAGERHIMNDDFNLDTPYILDSIFNHLYQRYTGSPFDAEQEFQYNATYSDYDRILTQAYYDDTPLGGRFNSRVGFAYTKTRNQVFNREVLYGLGYKLNEKWSVGFEHTYDLDKDSLRTQSYELRRNWHCIETAIRFRDRESGTDIDFAINLTAFPGSKIKF